MDPFNQGTSAYHSGNFPQFFICEIFSLYFLNFLSNPSFERFMFGFIMIVFLMSQTSFLRLVLLFLNSILSLFSGYNISYYVSENINNHIFKCVFCQAAKHLASCIILFIVAFVFSLEGFFLAVCSYLLAGGSKNMIRTCECLCREGEDGHHGVTIR